MFDFSSRHPLGLTIVSVLLVLSSCALNRKIVLSPIEPCTHEENGLSAGVPPHQDNWIYFDPDTNRFSFTLHIRSTTLPESVVISAIRLEIRSLDISVEKKGLNRSTSGNFLESGVDGYRYFKTITINGLFPAEDILASYNANHKKNIDKLSLYRRIGRAQELELQVFYAYSIQGMSHESRVTLRYRVKSDTSLRFWDTWMSV